MNDPKDFEDVIRLAVKKATKDGWIISPNITLDDTIKKCCPMGAVCRTVDNVNAVNQYNLGGCANYFRMASDALKITLAEVERFACGFDSQLVGNIEHPWYKLGQQMRKEWEQKCI